MDLVKEYENLLNEYRERALKEFENKVNEIFESSKARISELKEKALKDIIAK